MTTDRPMAPLVPPHCSTEADRYVLRYVRHCSTLTGTKPGRLYSGMDDFLLRHGRFWTPAPIPRAVKPMRVKYCFHNSRSLAARRRGLRYVEGVALGVIPIHHAWVVDPLDRVIDATWASVDPSYHDEYFNGIGQSYFGVEFPIRTVLNIVRSRENRARNESVFYAAPMDFWRTPFANRAFVLPNRMINSQEGGMTRGSDSNEDEGGQASLRRSAVEVSG